MKTVDGTIVALPNSVVIYQLATDDIGVSEPAIVVRLFEGDHTIQIVQGQNEVLLSTATVPLLIKQLKFFAKQ